MGGGAGERGFPRLPPRPDRDRRAQAGAGRLPCRRRSYDALLDIFEPGAEAAAIATVFEDLRPGLTALAARIAEAARPAPAINGHFPAAAQLALTRRITAALGYDLDAGRIDTVTHPFCSGTRGDTRITTRTDEADPLNCLYSTIHETGHALYEQGLDPALAGQPAGNSVSMGVHESQSRLYENQIGRSRAFCTWLWPQLPGTGLDSAEDLYRAINRVAPGFIRTEADEVHYNLHIMLRFDLERALIGGTLEVADLEDAWNARFEADFGREVPDAAQGVLQDVHWSAGLFGYFPTYTLGNIYAAELDTALRRAIPDADAQIAGGAFSEIRAWLRTHVHHAGSRDLPVDLMTRICGTTPSGTRLLAYLDGKFSELYGL